MSKSNIFLLPKDFYEKNALGKNTTAGHIAYFQMWMLDEPDFDQWVDQDVVAQLDEQRRHALLEERSAIESLSNPEEIIRYMRKPIEISNRNVLCRKAVEMGEELFPMLIDRLAKN